MAAGLNQTAATDQNGHHKSQHGTHTHAQPS